ncbi:hypothetical protein PG993_006957 [Apiospora rasikravindrae]|uniref:Uncharacterized protein n=1 Tax=Apiospora rasikravindrae TaxID=990691 RepID=A0ABR1SW46_9PEZI
MSEIPEQDAKLGNEQRQLGADASDKPNTVPNASVDNMLQEIHEHITKLEAKMDGTESAQEKLVAGLETVASKLSNIIRPRLHLGLDLARRREDIDAKIKATKTKLDAKPGQQDELPSYISRYQDSISRINGRFAAIDAAAQNVSTETDTLDARERRAAAMRELVAEVELEHDACMKGFSQQIEEFSDKMRQGLKTALDNKNRATGQGSSPAPTGSQHD